MLYLVSFCASISKMCPRLSEKPKIGYFRGLGALNFPYKLMVIASLIYISALLKVS